MQERWEEWGLRERWSWQEPHGHQAHSRAGNEPAAAVLLSRGAFSARAFLGDGRLRGRRPVQGCGVGPEAPPWVGGTEPWREGGSGGG